MESIYRQILDAISRDQDIIVQTILDGEGTGSISDLRRTIVTEGSDIFDQDHIYLETLDQGRPKFYQTGNQFVLLEPFYPKQRLIVLGAGHIAVPLVKIAAIVGFDVTVVDDRISFANQNRFPDAKEIVCDRFIHYIDQLHLTQSDYVVIITRGHRYDRDCLREIIKKPFPRYVGMIGSRSKVKTVIGQLAEEGYSSEKLERVCSPIGLKIGGVTPEEISISIIAEVIAKKRISGQDSTRINLSNVEHDVLKRLADVQEPCCVVTIVHAKGSVPRGTGAKMIVYPDGRIEGSIGGGCSEASMINRCMDIIGSGTYLLQKIDMTGTVAEDEGMVCGGIMHVLVEDYVGCAQ